MILKALYDYYHRSGNLAPFGTEYKEISFLIVIDSEGRFLRLEDRRLDKKRAQKFLVVKGSRTSGIKPYILWDNVEYLANYSEEHALLEKTTDSSKIAELRDSIAKTQAKHNAFVSQCADLASHHHDNAAIRAVAAFYQSGQLEKIYSDPLWSEIAKKPIVNLSFLLDGETSIVAEDICLRPKMEESTDGKESICLVTGNYGVPVVNTTSTPIAGRKSNGRLVSFQVSSGYDSYGKKNCYNAPISKDAEAAYTTALNKLLARDSRNKFVVGSRTFVFWASNESPASQKAEEAMFALVDFADDETDNPNARIDLVRSVFNGIYSGRIPSEATDRFFFLGLAPNVARIAVTYWNECSLKEFAGRILRHFDDMEIVDSRKFKKPYAGIYNILGAVTLNGKSSEVQPNLPEAVLKSILQNAPYPFALFATAMRRIRAEQNINITRAAIIKAYLNRLNNNNSKLHTMLDTNDTNAGYVCGRLFAILENIQERANGTATIGSRYLNSASATPGAVFATLLNLSSHHIDKLNPGQQIFFEKLKGEIIGRLGADGFPARLNLQDQGRFMVGYYHQRQDLYTSKADKKENN